jgi:uncharacterized protein (TIGR02466 family)
MNVLAQQTEIEIEIEASPAGFFETPIAYAHLKNSEQLIQSLEQSIRHRKSQDDGLQRSNLGGWHSDTNMLDWGGSSAKALANTAVKLAKRMSHFNDKGIDDYLWSVRMWANVTGKGGLNQPHVHPGNIWAAVLYLNMGLDANVETSVGGEFYLEDPRFPMLAMHTTAFRLMGVDGNPQNYQPEFKLSRGDLIVFPSWLRHGVRTYSGEKQRITIAMNINIIPKQ